ncbi:hypothetical protein SAMN04489724_1324 [Algoriphagus locisalis]|uniref:6-bladed beta-propeller protein n=1 Tax=Algoriphagus locisalis TaxID=305507 RepID=A0A1I6YZ99_9BACT|nr:6-bladed beta-propeller [Algoriphagus locisalis]SFT55777.1 hypothetical protein SAMN04489724_1324 [Algoriphagus locisalis]
MKKLRLFLICLLSSFLASCSSSDETKSEVSSDGLEIIKVDLSEAREGKLSEFFEPEIEYIWLKDDSEEAQLGGLNKVFFHEDKIVTLDVFDCECVKLFDKAGKYLSKLDAYGEGPGQYLEFDDAIIVGEEILLLGIYPPKLMWFDLDGKFLREEKLARPTDTGVFSEDEKRYYFFNDTREPGEHFVESVSETFQDTVKVLPYKKEGFYGNFSTRKVFQKTEKWMYFAMPFNDTIYQINSKIFSPKLVFDYGDYAQSIDELRSNSETLDPLQELDFINKKAQLYFVPNKWFIHESQLYSGFSYQEKSYNVFFDRRSQNVSVIKGRISDDLNEGFDPYSILYQYEEGKVGFTIPGKTLFQELQKKKAELGQEGFEEYVKGKGKNFAEAAFAAKDSENPVLIVYTVKK